MPANTPTPPSPEPRAEGRILVWDAPSRLVHWLLALCFLGAWLTAEEEAWLNVHATLGMTAGGLAAFRILWGLVGTRHARFTDFMRGPAAVSRYLLSLLSRHPEHHAGHNPAGALAIAALLALAVVVPVAGWATLHEVGGDWVHEVHESLASLMMGVVVVHLAGVATGCWLHRENLVAAMFSGRKRGAPREAIASAWRSVAAIVAVAVLAFWWLAWRDPPVPTGYAGHDHGHEHSHEQPREQLPEQPGKPPIEQPAKQPPAHSHDHPHDHPHPKN